MQRNLSFISINSLVQFYLHQSLTVDRTLEQFLRINFFRVNFCRLPLEILSHTIGDAGTTHGETRTLVIIVIM